MRRRLVALAATNTIMVALAFLIPLAVLVRTLARDRALSAAELEAQSLAPVLALTRDTTALDAAVRATNPGARGRLTIFLPDGDHGRRPARRRRPAPTTPERDNLALARQGRPSPRRPGAGSRCSSRWRWRPDQTAVVRVLVPDSLLERGVASAWAVEAALGITLVAWRCSWPTGWPAPSCGRSTPWPTPPAGSARVTCRCGSNPEGPPEVEAGGRGLQPPGRPGRRAAGGGARAGGRPVPPAPHSAHRPAPRRRGARRPGGGPPARRRRRRARAGGRPG